MTAPDNIIKEVITNWNLSPEESIRSNILEPAQLKKWQSIKFELVEALANFQCESTDAAVIFNQRDYWVLRGRLTLANDILSEHERAIGLVSIDVDSTTSQGDSPAFQASF